MPDQNVFKNVAAETLRDNDSETTSRRIEELLKKGLTPNDAVTIALLNNRELQAKFGRIGLTQAQIQGSLPENPAAGTTLIVDGHESLSYEAHFSHNRETPLPGVAPVALQQGRWAARNILRDLKEKARRPFVYLDKGQMATIGRSRAIMSFAGLEFRGFFAWLSWLVVHIYYLTGFRNRVFVVMQWAWSYVTFRRSARLIVDKEWRSFPQNSAEMPKV